MYKYVGDFKILEQLGFVMNIYKQYWFLPIKSAGKYDCPMVINIKDRMVEYPTAKQLEIIKDYIQTVEK